MKAYQRLLSYVKISTPSNEESSSSPSSQCQFDLARLLVEELKGLGISDVSLDEHCYVYAHLPATEGLEHCKALGFIAHMDTQKITMEKSSLSAQAAELFPRKCSPILLHLPGVP